MVTPGGRPAPPNSGPFRSPAAGDQELAVGVPWRDIDWPVALACGLVGSFVGGLLASIALGDGLALRPSGLIGSLLGAVLVTVGWTLASGRREG